ncbi:MAG: LON peptidase substrate-binding domain-containing protein, partial [Chloroflexi bacterium]|nr:LON peptidase substrate-binding domain-containing protein [Chloroflexota bacterium]
MTLLANGQETKTETKAPGMQAGQSTERLTIPEILPILPLKNTVVYPIPILLPLIVGQPRSIRLVDDAVLGNRII